MVVKNYALGYNNEIDLVEFKWNRNTGLYVLHKRFHELEPKDSDQLEEWQKNRRNAYRGSFEHFLKRLYDDNLTSNRFEPVLKGSQNRIQIAEFVSNNSEGGMGIHTSTPMVENKNTKHWFLVDQRVYSMEQTPVILMVMIDYARPLCQRTIQAFL